MNIYQIIGASLSFFAALFMFIGTYQQAKKDSNFQNGVEKFVNEQKKSDVPNLEAIRVVGDKNNYKLIIKNIGNKPADKARLLFTDNSTPNIFSGHTIVGAAEVPSSTEYELPLNVFDGIEALLRMPNSDDSFKKELEEYVKKFDAGKMDFIPRFHLEYNYNGEKYTSDEYFIVISKNDGILYLGKEKK